MNEERMIDIYESIHESGFSVRTLELIDNYINDILNGRTNLDRFNQQEHAGLCLADSPLIGAYADTSVIKERTSIYSTLDKALEAIVLHNALFPETQMTTIGFTRDSDGLFRIILTQPYIGCQRLATKAEIDEMVGAKGFHDNGDGNGVNYINERLHLEDMHPANVFIDPQSGKPICIDCIVKFRKNEQ